MRQGSIQACLILTGAALLAGLTSVASFLVLAVTTGGYTARLGGVVAADVVALVLLLGAAVLQVWHPVSPRSVSETSAVCQFIRAAAERRWASGRRIPGAGGRA